MPKNLTASQNRRLQRLRAHELKEKKVEEWRDRRFNELRLPPRQEWRPKPMEIEKPVVAQDEEGDLKKMSHRLLISNDSPPREYMDVNMVCMLPVEFRATDEARIA